MRRQLAVVGVCLALAACGGEQDSSARSATGTPTTGSDSSATASPSATSSLGEPLTSVPAEVMLTPDADEAEDNKVVEPWRAAYCPPEPLTPSSATAMRTRVWRGPGANLDIGPTEYGQQVAAFPDVEAAVAEAARLVAAADSCNADGNAAGPQVSELPLGTQARLVVFAEGGDYSIRGFFRRANAIVSVQGSGDADDVVRSVLNESFARLCIYERPDAC